jgi:ribosomal protein S12 methylthiotransferase
VDRLIPLMAEGRILPYLDIPFQHASPPVLKAMRRPANQEKMLDRIRAWREICPDLTLRSTFIVGFPGETDEDFERLLDWLDEAQLDRIGCFKYENVDGIAANALPDQIDEDEKADRQARLIELARQITDERMQAKVGRSLAVMIDEVDEDGAIGRSTADSPDVDGSVFIGDGQGLTPGDVVKVRIVAAEDYDLWGDLDPDGGAADDSSGGASPNRQ